MTWRKSNGERVKSQANFTVHIDYKACANCNVFVKYVLSRNSLYSVISRGREANTLGYISRCNESPCLGRSVSKWLLDQMRIQWEVLML